MNNNETKQPITIEDDPEKERITIAGVPFDYQFFRNFKAVPLGGLFRISLRRDDGLVRFDPVMLSSDLQKQQPRLVIPSGKIKLK